MAKRKKTTREEQNAGRLDRVMARMVVNIRKGEDTTINPVESALMLKIVAYALQRMKDDLEKGKESE